MKSFIKIAICLITFFTFSFQATANNIINNLETSFKKTKPAPKYEIDLVNKKINFIDVNGSYLIDNDHVDIVLEGIIKVKNYTIDISKLKPGVYLLEIEHMGYLFTEEFIIK